MSGHRRRILETKFDWNPASCQNLANTAEVRPSGRIPANGQIPNTFTRQNPAQMAKFVEIWPIRLESGTNGQIPTTFAEIKLARMAQMGVGDFSPFFFCTTQTPKNIF